MPVYARGLMSFFRWTLDPERDRPGVLVEDRATLLTGMATAVLLGGVLALPPVSRVVGIPALTGFLACASYAVWMPFVSLVLAPLSKRRPWVFQLAAVGNATGANLIIAVLAGSTGNPFTFLWLLHILYTAMNAALETGPVAWLFAIHVIAPLLVIPFFPESLEGARLAGPAIVSAGAAIAYLFLSRVTMSRVGLRAERDAALQRVREQQSELERLRIARDLHDGVGASLALLRLYADLVERHAGRAEETRRLATQIREAAADGLGDLRGALEAISPRDGTVASLVEGLRLLASRMPISLDIACEGDSALALPADLRLALVRVFQEGVRNAVTHGHAGRVHVTVRVHDELSIEIADDGAGFDPKRPTNGRGLPSMRTRATEFGGQFAIDSAPGRGTRVRLAVPVGGAERVA